MAWLTISGSQAPLRCWFERPDQPRSLVLVLPEVFGINGWLRDVASQLVAAGHGVLVMPLFARTAPELDVGYDAAGLAEGRLHRDAVTAAGFHSDVDAVMRALDTKQTGHVEYMDLYTALTKHIAVKEPLSAEKEKALMERLQGDAAVKSALDAMVRVLRSQHASSPTFWSTSSRRRSTRSGLGLLARGRILT